jgi:hypothetical protein
MFDDLPPDLERLLTLRVARDVAGTAGGSGPPRRSGSSSSASAPAARPSVQVHADDCYAAGNRLRTIDRDEARRLLASGLPGCPHRQPDVDLRILD